MNEARRESGAENIPSFDHARATRMMEASRRKVEQRQKKEWRRAAFAGTVLLLATFAGAAEKAGAKFGPARSEQPDSKPTPTRMTDQEQTPIAAVEAESVVAGQAVDDMQLLMEQEIANLEVARDSLGGDESFELTDGPAIDRDF